jgi:hypothetical protein
MSLYPVPCTAQISCRSPLPFEFLVAGLLRNRHVHDAASGVRFRYASEACVLRLVRNSYRRPHGSDLAVTGQSARDPSSSKDDSGGHPPTGPPA